MIVVDGNNVIGSRPDGWWRDRRAAERRLVDDVARWAASRGEETIVFFDGSAPAEPPSGDGVEVRFAPGARNAADDAIAEFVAAHPAPGEIAVVTSDADLARRVRAAGARVVGAGAFRAQLDVSGTPPPTTNPS